MTKLKNHCTSCFKHLGLSLAAVPKIRLHNVLKVTVCKSCFEFYNSGEFERGEDGSELFCRWCGQGGVVFCCTKCIYVFCKECIKRNLGTAMYKKIANDPAWSCFRCDSTQLLDLRARHHVFTNYLLNRQNFVNETAKNASQLKELLLEDMSSCCRSRNKALDGDKSDDDPDNDPTYAPIPKAGPSSAKGSPAPEPQAKRPREFSPGTAPGPLSKKLKKKEESVSLLKKAISTPPPPALPASAPKPVNQRKQALTGKPAKTYSPAPPKKQPPPQEQPQEDQDMDFSLFNPIVELQVSGAEDATGDRDSIDPLDMNGGSSSPNIQMANNQQQTWAPSPAPLQQQYQAPVSQVNNNSLWNPQQQPPFNNQIPDLDGFGFGSHFLAGMSGTPDFTTNLMPPAPVQPLVYQRPRMPGSLPMVRNRTSYPPRPVYNTPPRALPPGQTTTTTAQDSVFHYVNGFRIDLKAASEKQLITLPDGKVIHVRRHTTPSLVTPNAGGQPRMVSMQQQYQVRVGTRVPPLRYTQVAQPPALIRPVIPNAMVQMRQPQNEQCVVQKPRRKTTQKVRLNGSPTVSREVVLAKVKLSDLVSKYISNRNSIVLGVISFLSLQVGKLHQAITYTSNKCQTFQNSNIYKKSNSMADVIELHTNFALVLTYAQERFESIIKQNDAFLQDHTSRRVKEKPITEDELQLVEDRPACINLDSDEEIESGAQGKLLSPGIRCKTVTEINTQMSGTLVVSPRKGNAVKKQKASESDVIDLSDDEVAVKEKAPASAAEDDKKIVEDILDDLINSLFGIEDNKENTPPPPATDIFEPIVELSEEKKDEEHAEVDIDPMAVDLDYSGPSGEEGGGGVDDDEAAKETNDPKPESKEDKDQGDKKESEKEVAPEAQKDSDKVKEGEKEEEKKESEKPKDVEESSTKPVEEVEETSNDCFEDAKSTTSLDNVEKMVEDEPQKEPEPKENSEVVGEEKKDEKKDEKEEERPEKSEETVPEKDQETEVVNKGKEDKPKEDLPSEIISLDDSNDSIADSTPAAVAEKPQQENEKDDSGNNSIISLDDSKEDEILEEQEEKKKKEEEDPQKEPNAEEEEEKAESEINVDPTRPEDDEMDPFGDIMDLDGILECNVDELDKESEENTVENPLNGLDEDHISKAGDNSKEATATEEAANDEPAVVTDEPPAEPMDVDGGAEEDGAAGKEQVAVAEKEKDQTIDDVFSVLETISKEIDMKEDSETTGISA